MDEFNAYRQQLLDALGDDDLIEALAQAIWDVRELTEGLTTEQMRMEPEPGEWSGQQILTHIADAEVVMGWRIRLALTEDRPALTAYDQDAWAARFSYLDQSARQTYHRWRLLREANHRLFSSLSDEEWGRVGIHGERGEESVNTMARMLAGHDRVHIEQLRKATEGMTRPHIILPA